MPHVTNVILSQDARYLMYTSKKVKRTRIPLVSTKCVLTGALTRVLRRKENLREIGSDAEPLCFSILYVESLPKKGKAKGAPEVERSLDLKANSIGEAELWVTGLKALIMTWTGHHPDVFARARLARGRESAGVIAVGEKSHKSQIGAVPGHPSYPPSTSSYSDHKTKISAARSRSNDSSSQSASRGGDAALRLPAIDEDAQLAMALSLSVAAANAPVAGDGS